MRRALALLLPLVLMLGVAPPASADRAPTKTERARVSTAWSIPARCLVIRVSTVSKRYVSARFNHARYRSCKRYASDGIAILRLSGRRDARALYAGSDCRAPSARVVPRRVWRDLTRRYCG
ncbi:MAG: hypothetical protein M0P31_09065 [Solirubrobacteraceae bacterium]|nr:hypothetical protein [Solirubrobacteraceae bacterium]